MGWVTASIRQTFCNNMISQINMELMKLQSEMRDLHNFSSCYADDSMISFGDLMKLPTSTFGLGYSMFSLSQPSAWMNATMGVNSALMTSGNMNPISLLDNQYANILAKSDIKYKDMITNEWNMKRTATYNQLIRDRFKTILGENVKKTELTVRKRETEIEQRIQALNTKLKAYEKEAEACNQEIENGIKRSTPKYG